MSVREGDDLESWVDGYDQAIEEVLSELDEQTRLALCTKFRAWRRIWEKKKARTG